MTARENKKNLLARLITQTVVAFTLRITVVIMILRLVYLVRLLLIHVYYFLRRLADNDTLLWKVV